MQFTGGANGWAVGEAGAILHPRDDGATWIVQPSGLLPNLADVSFVDVQTGWAVGVDGFSGVILHTADGGATWTPQATIATDALLAVHFVDAQIGWAVGGRTILHTTDAASGVYFYQLGRAVTPS